MNATRGAVRNLYARTLASLSAVDYNGVGGESDPRTSGVLDRRTGKLHVGAPFPICGFLIPGRRNLENVLPIRTWPGAMIGHRLVLAESQTGV